GKITCKFIQPHSKASAFFADEVDLHYNGAAPGQSLIYAEQYIGKDHPTPVWCIDEDKGHGNGHQPSEQQKVFAPEPVGKSSCKIIGKGFRQAKGSDERKDRGFGCHAKFYLCKLWENGSFHPDHPADKGVYNDQDGKLFPVFFKTEFHRIGSHSRKIRLIFFKIV